VIDLGCGTGEHSILFASRGHRVLGVDSAPLAIKKAKSKASDRGSSAEFMLADATDLSSLRRTFDLAIDSGLFHVFSDEGRGAYVRSLSSLLRPGGRYFMLCFSDREADWGGPRRVRREEVLEAFSNGWKVNSIRPSRFDSAYPSPGAAAWFCCITKTA
jgi:cyclopropane fatty-acyl-phospholipid synthase-like methyltransferase